MSEPSEDVFFQLKKDEPICLAKHLQIEVKKCMRKYQVQDVIMKRLVSKNIFEESILEGPKDNEVALAKLQLQLECKKLEMQEREQKGEIEREKEEKKQQFEREEKEQQERLEMQQRQAAERREGRMRKARKIEAKALRT